MQPIAFKNTPHIVQKCVHTSDILMHFADDRMEPSIFYTASKLLQAYSLRIPEKRPRVEDVLRWLHQIIRVVKKLFNVIRSK